jgi:tetratricopeptide (TPR) repeat protein
MRLRQFRVRTLMIAVAILAPLFTAAPWFADLSTALNEFSGPGGKLDLERRIGIEISAGSNELRHGRYVQAEARYRSAEKLAEKLEAISVRHDWSLDSSWTLAKIGLADALVGQGSYDEADLWYHTALKHIGPDLPAAAEYLECYANCATATGDLDKAQRLFTRARVRRESGSR